MNRIVTIDPGISGGIAYVDDEGLVQAIKIPPTLEEKYETFKKLRQDTNIVITEDVGYHRRGNSAMASCTLARHCGELMAMLVSLGYAVTNVRPKAWQKRLPMKLPLEYNMKKRALKMYAQKAYPHLKVTLATADALCIMNIYNPPTIEDFLT